MEGSHPFITNDIPGYIGAPFRIGLYDENGDLVATWDELVESGDIELTDSTIDIHYFANGYEGDYTYEGTKYLC